MLDFGLAALKANARRRPVAFAVPLRRAVGIRRQPDRRPARHSALHGPRAARDGKQADVRSDVWGLGVTLYELLTLQRPSATGQAVLETEPTPPRQLTPALDRDLEAVVLKALRKDPAHRYPTAQALADDLNHWLNARAGLGLADAPRLHGRPGGSGSGRGGTRAGPRRVPWRSLVSSVLASSRRSGVNTPMEREQPRSASFSSWTSSASSRATIARDGRRDAWRRIAGTDSGNPRSGARCRAWLSASLSGLDTRTEKEICRSTPSRWRSPPTGGSGWATPARA